MREMGEASSGSWRVPNGKRVVSIERLGDSQRQPNSFYNFAVDLVSVCCVFSSKKKKPFSLSCCRMYCRSDSFRQ